MRYFSCSVTVLKPIAAVLDFVLISLFSLTLSFFHRPLNQSSILPRFFLRLFLFSSSRMVLQHLTLVTSNSHFFANQECNRSCNILELNQIMDWNIFQYFTGIFFAIPVEFAVDFGVPESNCCSPKRNKNRSLWVTY